MRGTVHEDLVRRGMIRPFSADAREVEELLELARRDADLAEELAGDSLDWAEIVAYNSMLQSGRALMFHRGYRPAGESHHVAVIAFLERELGGAEHDLMLTMANLRKKRNTALYCRSGSVSEREVASAVSSARSLLRVVEAAVGGAHEDGRRS